MRWTVHGERSIYESEWINLALVDVEPPGGERFEHHVIRSTADAAGALIDDPERGVLLLWRHRFISDTWGWELPAGRVDPGEDVETAARRECIEETGWAPSALTPLVSFRPYNGQCDATFHIMRATSATLVGEPTDPYESERIEWVSWERIRGEIHAGSIGDGLSLTALLHCLAFAPSDAPSDAPSAPARANDQ